MSLKEAEQQARAAFGNRTLLEQRSRDVWQWPTLESIAADVRFALRQLRKSPGFTIAAVLTLALAIGANAVVFGIMDGLVLRPLNVPQSESLYGTHYGDNLAWQSYPNYIDLRDRNRSFEDLAAFNMVLGVGFDAGKDPIAANGFATTGNYFDVLRIHPYLGRLFHASDEHGPNSAPYVVLTYAYWHSRFHDDPGVVGRIVQLDKHPFTIIGVAPPEFQGTIMFLAPDFFMPIVNEEQMGAPSLTTRATEHAVFEALGHLKPGVTPAQAVADVDAVSGYLEKTYPREIVHHGTELSREGLTAFGPAVRAFVAGLMVLSGLILLAACANLGSLFAARAADRSREVALRLALGSSRKRILRGLLTEALLISLAGGAAGLLVSFMLLRRMSIWQPIPAVPLHLPVTPDANALRGCFGFGSAQRILIRHCADTPDPPRQSIRDRQGGVERQDWAQAHDPRCAPRRPDCNLRGSGHVFAGGRARACTLAAQQVRFRSARHDDGRRGPGHGRLQRRQSARHAEADDRSDGDDPRSGSSGTGEWLPSPGLYRRQPGRCVQGRNQRSEASERRCHAFPVRGVSGILRSCGHNPAGGQELLLAGRQERARRSRHQSRFCRHHVWLGHGRNRQELQAAGRNPCPGCGGGGGRKIHVPH